MIKLKTAVLLGFSLQLGGLLADYKDNELLYEIGVNAGIGFQLMDDLLDVYGEAAKVGKQVGGDIIANKKTYLLLRAIELTKGTSEGEKLQALLNDKSIFSSDKVREVTAIYNTVHIKEEAEQLMRSYFDKALVKLESVPVSSERKASLNQMLVQLMGRVR